jgi:Uma2 family endonuclease
MFTQKLNGHNTADDLWVTLQRARGRHYELINGEIVERPTDETVNRVRQIISDRLALYVRERKLGRVALDTGYRRSMDANNVRFPDVAFISYERTVPLPKKGFTPYMPDLAIQIKSRHMTTIDVAERGIYFLKNGGHMVWLIHPAERYVSVLSRTNRRQLRIYRVDGDSILGGSDILPGFSLPLTDVFGEAPST